jgi:hypothetical protein
MNLKFGKRKYVKKHILTESYCNIGSNILCFELEIICDDKCKYFYNHATNKKIKYMTIGKFYEILDYKNNKVKLFNDIGEPHWYTIRRFLKSCDLHLYFRVSIL